MNNDTVGDSAEYALAWAGAGIYMWWQLGVVQYLAERYNVSSVRHVGASAGALTALIAACGVKPQTALESAYDISEKAGLWQRPWGLLGAWGGLVREWLDQVLPTHSAQHCSGRAAVIVAALPFMQQVAIEEFKDRQDVIEVAMTSVHIPFFMNGWPVKWCRGRPCIDGSLPDYARRRNCAHFSSATLVIDYEHDDQLGHGGRLSTVALRTLGDLRAMLATGYAYGQRLHAAGRLSHLPPRTSQPRDVLQPQMALQPGLQAQLLLQPLTAAEDDAVPTGTELLHAQQEQETSTDCYPEAIVVYVCSNSSTSIAQAQTVDADATAAIKLPTGSQGVEPPPSSKWGSSSSSAMLKASPLAFRAHASRALQPLLVAVGEVL